MSTNLALHEQSAVIQLILMKAGLQYKDKYLTKDTNWTF